MAAVLGISDVVIDAIVVVGISATVEVIVGVSVTGPSTPLLVC